ncbi:MAG TPA: preprotein translocase subunit SecG [Alphaproteobacteria bacterium]|nr:preprotein translocase subunit SecG [Alphaproteobacteria bacterium]
MIQIVLVIHLLIAIGLVGVVLLQRSEGGGLGIGGGGGGGGGFMSGRGTANLLTRTTAILAACFFVTSLVLAILASGAREGRSIMDQPGVPAQPAVPSEPQVPMSQ